MIMVLLPACAFARDYYVATNGNDRDPENQSPGFNVNLAKATMGIKEVK